VISVKKELEGGSTYLIEDETLDFAYDVFSKLVDTDNKTLCVTRKHPEKIQDEYNIGDTDFVWLSTSNEAIAVGPKQLDVLSLTIEGFLSDEGDTILIDGLGYLFSNNPVSTIIQFLQSIQDQITTGNTKLLFAISPSSIEDKYYNLINNELNPKVISLIDEGKKKKEKQLSPKGQQEDLVDDMKNMVDYLEDEERELEDKVDKLNQQSAPSQTSNTSDVVLDAINSLRDEVSTLRNQLNKQEGQKVREKRESTEPTTEERIREIVREKEKSEMKEEKEGKEETEDKTDTEEVVTVEEEKEIEENEPEEEQVEEEITDERIKEIIDIVKDRIKEEEEEESDIPEEYLERIIEEVKRELKEETEITKEESIEEEDETDEEKQTEERIIKEEGVSKPEIEEETFEGVSEKEIETKTSEQEEPTVGDILKTVEKEKESEKEKETSEVTKKETEVEDETENKVKIEKGIHVKGSLESDDDIVLKDKSTIDGDVISRKGNVTVGEDCRIKGKVKGIQVDISDESEIDEIDAEEDITLGKDVNVKKIRTDGDVELHKGVTVEEEIEYGEHLFFKGDGIKVGNLIHPIKSEEVVEEQWASQ